MAKKTNLSPKETTVLLAISKAGGAYQFWRKIAEAGGAGDFKLQYGENGFEERAVGRGKTLGVWKGGNKAWHHSGDPIGHGFIGGKMLVGKEKKGILVSSVLTGK